MMHEDLNDPEFAERMEQASLLPGHDPVRRAVVQEVAARGGEAGAAGRMWLSLLEESERMKLAIMTVEVPARVEKRLLGVPDRSGQGLEIPWWKRPVSEILTVRRLCAAAAIVLIIAAGWWGVMSVMTYREGREVERVALIAADVHQNVLLSAPGEHIDTVDPNVAQAWLAKRVNFPAIMIGNGGAKLMSASVTQLGGAPAALTCWERDGHRYSLFEFVPSEAGLSANFAKRITTTPAGYKVVSWSEPNRGCGWALVMDSNAQNTFTY